MRTPKYRLHRASGRAVIQSQKLYGTTSPHYLKGKYGSPESLADYATEIKRLATGIPSEPSKKLGTVAELLDAFMIHAAARYSEDGCRGPEYQNFLSSTKLVNKLYGEIQTADFGAVELEAVQEAMIAKGWARKHINRQIVRVRQIFRWGVKQKMVPADVIVLLGIVRGLSAGRTNAREKPPVRPAAWVDVEAVFPHLPPMLVTMVRIHWLTAMRSGELVTMRAELIDRSKDVWQYRPKKHKNLWRGIEAVVAIGPQAQQLLMDYMAIGVYLFRPSIAIQERGKKRTKVGERYTTHSYHNAIKHAMIQLAQQRSGQPDVRPKKGEPLQKWLADRGVQYWHPNQLRHARATLTREKFGLEAAQAQLGHTNIRTTEIYAEKSLAVAARLAIENG